MMKQGNLLFPFIVGTILFKSMKFVIRTQVELEEDLWKEKFKQIQLQENIIKKKILF